MNPTTLTMAGHLANAGAARPFACAAPAFATGLDLASTRSIAMIPAIPAAATAPSAASHAAKGGYGTHQASTWTKGATADTTLVVIDRKNRPPRPLSEHSP